MKKEVLQAARELVDMYRSITIEQLKDVENNIEELTGFGCTASCKLCNAVGVREGINLPNCKDCIFPKNKYVTNSYCVESASAAKTYEAIDSLMGEDNYEEMKQALNDRADYIESLLPKG